METASPTRQSAPDSKATDSPDRGGPAKRHQPPRTGQEPAMTRRTTSQTATPTLVRTTDATEAAEIFDREIATGATVAEARQASRYVPAAEARAAGYIDWIALANAAKAKASQRQERKAKASQPRQPSLCGRFLAELVTGAPQGIEVPLTGAVALWVASQPAGSIGAGKTPEASIAAQIYTARKAGTLPARVTLDKRGANTWIVIASLDGGAA